MSCACCSLLTAYNSTNSKKFTLIGKFSCRNEIAYELNLSKAEGWSVDITGPAGEVDVVLKLSDGRWYLQSQLDRNFDWELYNSIAADDIEIWQVYDRYVYLYSERHLSDLRDDKPAVWHGSPPAHNPQWEPTYE